MQLNVGRPLYSTKQHKRTNTRDYFKIVPKRSTLKRIRSWDKEEDSGFEHLLLQEVGAFLCLQVNGAEVTYSFTS